MPQMCRGCPDVNKLRGMKTTILGQHRPFISIKSFVQQSGWQEMVSLCSLICLIGVCADCDQPEFLCSCSATAGVWLTRYRPREVRNWIYRYRKIRMDYRSKFLYRFISTISIIYGNTRIYLDLQGQIYLQSQNLHHLELVHTITHHPFKLEPPNLDQRCKIQSSATIMHATITRMPV